MQTSRRRGIHHALALSAFATPSYSYRPRCSFVLATVTISEITESFAFGAYALGRIVDITSAQAAHRIPASHDLAHHWPAQTVHRTLATGSQLDRCLLAAHHRCYLLDLRQQAGHRVFACETGSRARPRQRPPILRRPKCQRMRQAEVCCGLQTHMDTSLLCSVAGSAPKSRWGLRWRSIVDLETTCRWASAQALSWRVEHVKAKIRLLTYAACAACLKQVERPSLGCATLREVLLTAPSLTMQRVLCTCSG
jgi:hypothetical protein